MRNILLILAECYVLEFKLSFIMSSITKNIYDEHIKPLPREQQIQLLDLLREELENGDESRQPHSILELHGLGKEIWKGVDPEDYVSKLRDEWEDRAKGSLMLRSKEYRDS